MSKSLMALGQAGTADCCSPGPQEALPAGRDDPVMCCAPLSQQPLSAEQAEQVAPLLKALAGPVRRRLR